MNIKQIAGYSIIGLGLGLGACQKKQQNYLTEIMAKEHTKRLTLEMKRQKQYFNESGEALISYNDTLEDVPLNHKVPNSETIGYIYDNNGNKLSKIVKRMMQGKLKKEDVFKYGLQDILTERDTITHVPFDCYIPNSKDIGVIKDSSGKAVSRIVEVITKIKK